MHKTVMYIDDVQRTLFKKYRDFSHYNPDDPFKQLLFIICSTKTHKRNYLRTYQSLKRHIKDYKDYGHSRVNSMVTCLIILGRIKRVKLNQYQCSSPEI